MIDQQELFAAQSGDGDTVSARFHPDFANWQRLARTMLERGVAPPHVWWIPDWQREPHPAEADAPRTPAGGRRHRVPRSFLALARGASCHRAGDRWALLYRLLWRLTRGEPHLLRLGGDADVARITRYKQAVARDLHKMKAFVRFRRVDEPGFDASRYVAWFEPEHHIVEAVSPFFAKRFANMRWSILTPARCAHYDGGGELWFSSGTDRSSAPQADALEGAWQTYYASIFNPARLKIAAMCAEMPQKYWKNLPEAAVIPQLIRSARARTEAMIATAPAESTLHCGPRPATPAQQLQATTQRAEPGSLEALQISASACQSCPLAGPATQTVFGEGPQNARLMLIGEQPGDAEDLAGRPFVGPAGRCLDRALLEAGIDRSEVYLTNTVKHFKFSTRGKRRIHQRPDAREVFACGRWLDAEIDRIKPEVIVCLGVTAATAQVGHRVSISHDRGQLLPRGDHQLLLTGHPAQVLRLPDARSRERAFTLLVRDLRTAAAQLSAGAPLR